MRTIAILVNLVSLLCLLAATGIYATADSNSARVRNSLIATAGAPADFDWPPEATPADFRSETRDPPPAIVAAVDRIERNADVAVASEFSIAKRIASHLVANKSGSGAIQSSVTDTYEQIVNRGVGYCADYSQVFSALALAMNIPVREWGIAWDGFGMGHTFNEIFDTGINKWIFIDAYHSMYVVDRVSGRPLSALEFQARLLQAAERSTVAVVPIDNDKFFFENGDAALRYYARGADQFYLFWGNNVFSYDDHVVVRSLKDLPRAVEVMGAIASRVHPQIRLVETDTNDAHIHALLRVRSLLLAAFALAVAMTAVLIWQVVLAYRARSARSGNSAPA